MREIKKAESLKSQIYNLLKEDILNQEYDKEEILNERKISDELRVSRSPVREALKALEAEDWVEYIPYKGIVVKKMTEADLKNIFQIRRALELLAVEIAVPNLTANNIKDLEACYEIQKNMLVKPENQLFIEMDVKFHGILMAATDNKILIKMISDIRDKIRRFGMNAIFSGAHRYVETVEEHEAILNAIKSNDVDLAKQAMHAHMNNTYERARDYILS